MKIKALIAIAIVALVIAGGAKLGRWIDTTSDRLAGGTAGSLYSAGK